MKILTSEQMAAIDRRSIDTYGIPSIVLMENAAIGVAEAVGENYPSARSALVVCGTGNNGGDGFAVARHLHQREMIVTLVLAGTADKLSGDAKTNYEICGKLGLTLKTIESEENIEEIASLGRSVDLVIDALFGTGLDRPVEGYRAELIEALNSIGIPIVAVDLPSGLRGSSPVVEGSVVQADLTVTFARPKIPHVFPPAADLCGTVVVADISIPDAAVDDENCQLDLITPVEVVSLFEPRQSDTHKGTYGHVALIAGSEGRTGAAIMAARSAVRGGAGLVSVVTDRASADLIDSVSIESMSKPFEMASSSIDAIIDFVSAKDAVLLGPGLADDDRSYELIRGLVERIELPMVIDASGLNAFEDRIRELRSDSVRIITPHPGELGRLVSSSAGEINQDRVGSARGAAAESGAIVVLKGHQTVVADPGGRVSVNTTGNPGMASGGMGDVLAGLLVAILARADDPFEAARAAVYVHGMAADILRNEVGDIGLRAMEVAEAIPRAVLALRDMSE